MAVAAVSSVPEFTVEQLEQMLRAKKDQARQNGPEMRKKLEAYCLKEFGMSLASVISSTRKAPTPKTFKNPANGELYTYPGKGKYPDWLQRNEQRKAYAV
jgi:DNA-binding protein H-NS